MDVCPAASDDAPAPPLPPPPVVPCSNVVRVRFSGGAAAGQPHPALARQPPPPTRKGPASAPSKKDKAAVLGPRGRGVCGGVSVFPSRRRQRQAVGRLMRQAEGYQLEAGDTYALLWAQWWQCWKEFVHWTDKELTAMDADKDEGDDEEEGQGNGALTPVPPPIDNRALLVLGSTDRLKPTMEQCVDYEALPIEAWNALLSWYGGGPAILRQMKLTEAGELWLDMTAPLTPAANDHALQSTSMQVDEVRRPCFMRDARRRRDHEAHEA